MERFAGKTVVVTGAASGIGRGAAEGFAREGASVVLVDVNAGAGERASEELAAAGFAVRFLRGDVTSPDDCAAAVTLAQEAFGGLDVLVNSAGVADGSLIGTLSEATWDRVVDVNLKGVFLASQAAYRVMSLQGRGAIVNVASLAGILGGQGMGAYAASKGGVIQLTKVLALEGAPHGVRANAVCPVWIETPMFDGFLNSLGSEAAANLARRKLRSLVPMGRFGRVEEVTGAILFLASDEASYITGVALPIDGGTLCQ